MTTYIISGIIVLLILTLIFGSYVKAPPDVAYIVSGFRKEPKILIGKAGFRIPYLERLDKLLLRQITIDVKTGTYIPTLDFINVQVDAVVKVRVSTDPDKMKLAMKNFLNKGTNEIMLDLQDSLQGNMREIIGTISLKDISNDRDAFSNQVQNKASVDMERLGIEIISCNIQNVEDKNGLIEDMGMDNTSRIKKDASIAKAEADRDVAIAQARADKEANDARVLSETEIAMKNNELEIKRAELKKLSDIKKAEADAAYEIQEQEQRKSIEIASANANIAKQELEVELKTREADVREQELSATIKKKADAERYASQQAADVELYKRQKEAEAKRFEAEQEAEAKRVKAESDRFAMEQESLGIKARGEAEAQAIKARALAEAEGIDKKAEAMSKMKEAAILEMYFNALPGIAENISKPLQNINKIDMYGDGNISNLVGDITKSTTQITEGLSKGLGVDMKSMLAGILGAKTLSNNKEIETLKESVKDIGGLKETLSDISRNLENETFREVDDDELI